MFGCLILIHGVKDKPVQKKFGTEIENYLDLPGKLYILRFIPILEYNKNGKYTVLYTGINEKKKVIKSTMSGLPDNHWLERDLREQKMVGGVFFLFFTHIYQIIGLRDTCGIASYNTFH